MEKNYEGYVSKATFDWLNADVVAAIAERCTMESVEALKLVSKVCQEGVRRAKFEVTALEINTRQQISCVGVRTIYKHDRDGFYQINIYSKIYGGCYVEKRAGRLKTSSNHNVSGLTYFSDIVKKILEKTPHLDTIRCLGPMRVKLPPSARRDFLVFERFGKILDSLKEPLSVRLLSYQCRDDCVRKFLPQVAKSLKCIEDANSETVPNDLLNRWDNAKTIHINVERRTRDIILPDWLLNCSDRFINFCSPNLPSGRYVARMIERLCGLDAPCSVNWLFGYATRREEIPDCYEEVISENEPREKLKVVLWPKVCVWWNDRAPGEALIKITVTFDWGSIRCVRQ